MNKVEQLKELVTSIDGDSKKFYEKGNAAAGKRLRAAMQNLKKLAQEIRLEVQAAKNSKS